MIYEVHSKPSTVISDRTTATETERYVFPRTMIQQLQFAASGFGVPPCQTIR